MTYASSVASAAARVARAIAMLAVTLALPPDAHAFDLGSRERVAILGDSNTSSGLYFPLFESPVPHFDILESYALLRFADRKVTFLNRAIPGTSSKSARKWLMDSVLAEKPTVLLTVLGGIDAFRATREEDRLRINYRKDMRRIAAKFTGAGVHVLGRR